MGGWVPWLIGIGLAVLVIGAVAIGRPRGERSSPGRGATRPPRRGTTRTGKAPAATRPRSPARPTTRPTRPRAGEIWWADVPYQDGTGSKVRPCLVLRTRRGGADVLKITSQQKGNRTDHVRLPTRQWDPRAEHDSFLDVAEPIRLATPAFERHAGTCDPTIWRAIRRLHGVRG